MSGNRRVSCCLGFCCCIYIIAQTTAVNHAPGMPGAEPLYPHPVHVHAQSSPVRSARDGGLPSIVLNNEATGPAPGSDGTCPPAPAGAHPCRMWALRLGCCRLVVGESPQCPGIIVLTCLLFT